ncbi:MAG: hypothetical protein ACRD6X_03605, partial [Pyrinomonadaceae bacterium]
NSSFQKVLLTLMPSGLLNYPRLHLNLETASIQVNQKMNNFLTTDVSEVGKALDDLINGDFGRLELAIVNEAEFVLMI